MTWWGTPPESSRHSLCWAQPGASVPTAADWPVSLTLPLNALLVTQFAGEELGAWAVWGGVVGSFAEVLVGALVGYARNLQLQGTSLLKEKALMEHALRESQERFQLAAEGADEGLWDWPDTSQDAEWWSPRWYELLGYADGEVEASFTNFKAFLHPDDRDELAHAVTRHLEDHLPFEMEYRLRTKSGDYRWFQGRGRTRVDQNGKAVRMSGSIRDITQRKVSEDPNSVPWTHDFARSRSWRVLVCLPGDSPTTSTTYWPVSWGTPASLW